jgi:hypothetical protein
LGVTWFHHNKWRFEVEVRPQESNLQEEGHIMPAKKKAAKKKKKK